MHRLVLLAFVALVAATGVASAAARSPDALLDPYIVVLHEEGLATAGRAATGTSRAGPAATIDRLEAAGGFRASRRYRHALLGFAARLGREQVARLRADPSVESITRDRPVQVAEQAIPTGVDRVEADLPGALSDIGGEGPGADVDIAIIDTGIARGHPELDVRGGRDCTTSGGTGAIDDVTGHGTHVAGIAAARDNDIGVVGVAPGARLWSVRVFTSSGYGSVSSIVCAIDWVAGRREPVAPGSSETRPVIEVANMSLRGDGADEGPCGPGPTYDAIDDPEHRAICRAVAGGTTFVVAAGNDRQDAKTVVPAAYDEVITVASLADYDGRPGSLSRPTCATSTPVADDRFAAYSNFGADVDIIAPGTCIRSTTRDLGYGDNSGTSMAAPAVAGAAALYLAEHPSTRPEQVRAALRAAGTFEWVASTDRDGRPDRLLDVARLTGPVGFDVALPRAPAAIGDAGGSVSLPVELLRSGAHSDSVSLFVDDLPAGFSADFAQATLSGTDVSTTLTVDVPPGTPDGRYAFTVRATSAGAPGAPRSASETIVVDRTPPAVTVPVMGFAQGAGVDGGLPVRTTWTATDDATGIARTDLDELRGTAWRPLSLSSPTTTSIVRDVASGTAVAYRVKARDGAGNPSGWAVSGTVTPILRDSRSARLTYSTGWKTITREEAIGESVASSRFAGATVTTRFTGRAVAVFAPRASSLGRIEVEIDGTRVATVDLHASSRQGPRILFSTSWPTSGSHTLVLRALTTPDRPRIEVDAVAFLR